ncbi:MAG TPA: hypothetical protein VIG99_12660 [Myxococcaceae bacterium]
MPIAALAAAVLLAAAPSPAAPGQSDKPKMAVMELSPGGVEPHVAAALTESVTQEVASRGFFQVISSREIRTLLGFERQKQMVGCSGEQSCLAELADAMGARFVLSGTISRLGDALQLSIQVLDGARAQPLGRSIRIARDLSTLQAQLPYAVAEATATPLPPPPSRVLPYSLIGGGALVVVGSAVIGIDGVSRDLALVRELQSGNPVIRPLSAYQAERATISVEKTLGLAGFIAGAGLVAAGVLLNPPEAVSGAKVAVVPSAGGIAVVGVWP